MILMRHESIQTTMAYYIDLDADEPAEDLFRDFGQAGTVFDTIRLFKQDCGSHGVDVTPC
jgi:hypothetical protein